MPFTIIEPTAPRVPILVSVPHCGTIFPDDLKSLFLPDKVDFPDDVDFFVDRLYAFAPSMGITLIKAEYCRWVIDLNRSPANQSLYNDGRIITSLTPTTDFFGKPLYKDTSYVPSAEEVEDRKAKYYTPYYTAVQAQLDSLKAEFGHALLWDAHSIRRSVPTIHPMPFPDLILGDNDEQSADESLIDTALSTLNVSPFEVEHNYPFKGGNITRHFGKPEQGIHALQLEMAKPLYMDDTEQIFDESRAAIAQKSLQTAFLSLIEALSEL